ncbi:cation-translocating P-type ATPase [Alcanivorax sediminis]|uniref:P-type Cu(+) transporter n=1 Tax=Alcanivorax sediminis TaxID=2663008 RepID=A0A6N7LVV8_9GAMM|nr:HAD-IC family P-type ATPase [Alcanivorax sediminis]MQX54577.1 HAD-IC family P-type ATPase [Alcanivorax sediminis]
MDASPQRDWHYQTETSLLQTLGSLEGGLSDAQVRERRQRFGENRLLDQRRRGPWRRLAGQFHNVLLYVLLVAAVLALFMGHTSDAVVIVMVVLINAVVGFVQEGKAEAALQAIQQMLVSSCRVWRGGQIQTLDAAALVPGDRVVLAAGDRVPADLRLLSVSELHCDEATLTGESVPVGKRVATLPEETILAERHNMVWMGSLVTTGSAEGLVVATGTATQLGRIGEMVATVQSPETPLTRALGRLGRQLAMLILVLSAVGLAWAVLAMGLAPSELLPVAVGIVVAAIPEGLPAIVTITLAIGVQRMAKSHAVIRKLPVVEVLGSVTVICSDKTGTLTRNEMTTRTFVTSAGRIQIGGEGYAPEGAIDSDTPAALALFEQAAQVAMLCNDARLEQAQEQWRLHGDPTEGALYVMARKAGLDEGFRQGCPRLAELPFATERLYMATLNQVGDQQQIMVKGAPERLLGLCEYQQTAQGHEALAQDVWQQALDSLAGEGLRVLALATRWLPTGQPTLTEQDLESGLVLLGLAGTLDPPREEAVTAVAECRRAGIRVKMITGDNPQTARVIASQVGLAGGKVMTGKMLAQTSDAELDALLNEVDVFARTSPADKLRLVERLQAGGQVVAMTGDGVNDAPALQRADIGIAMGGKGTDAARDAAGMVLTDDNFATIAAAVREGRTVYDNIVKALLFILPTSLIEAMVLMVAVVLGVPLPITPVQILWVNMITAISLALALAFEQGESDLMARPPRSPRQGLVTPLLLFRLAWLGIVGTAAVFWQYHRFDAEDLDRARSMAVLTLVWIEIVYLFACRRVLAPAWSRLSLKGVMPALLASAVVVVLQWAFLELPPLQQLFGSVSLSWHLWSEALFTALLVLLAVEGEKALVRLLRGAHGDSERVMNNGVGR